MKLNVAALKHLRLAAGQTQGGLATSAGVSRATVQNLEAGRRHHAHISTIDKLARALGVQIADIALLPPEGTRPNAQA